MVLKLVQNRNASNDLSNRNDRESASFNEKHFARGRVPISITKHRKRQVNEIGRQIPIDIPNYALSGGQRSPSYFNSFRSSLARLSLINGATRQEISPVPLSSDEPRMQSTKRYSLDETTTSAYGAAGSAISQYQKQIKRLGSLKCQKTSEEQLPTYESPASTAYCGNTRLEWLSISRYKKKTDDKRKVCKNGFININKLDPSTAPAKNRALTGKHLQSESAFMSGISRKGHMVGRESKQFKGSEEMRTAIVKSTDMSDAGILGSTNIVASILSRNEDSPNWQQGFMMMAREIKLQHDKSFGGFWHCIVGQHFAAFVTHDSGTFAYINYGTLSILIFKSM